MANFDTLKTAIVEVVKTNGNNEITGALLQDTLLAMVDSLGTGYQFKGGAVPSTDPGTPDQKVAYFAGPGTYPNFGPATIPDGYVGIFFGSGSTWNVATAKTSPFTAVTVASDIIQLMDGTTPVYPRTRAEAVFFGNDQTDTLDEKVEEIEGNISQLGQEVGVLLVYSGTATSGTSFSLKPLSLSSYPLSVGSHVMVRVDSSAIAHYYLQDKAGNRLFPTALSPGVDYDVEITTAPTTSYGIQVSAANVTGNGSVTLKIVPSYEKTLVRKTNILEKQEAINTDVLTRNTDVLTRFNTFEVLTPETTNIDHSIEALMRTGILKYLRLVNISPDDKFSLMYLGISSRGSSILRIVAYGTGNYAVNYSISSGYTPSNHIVAQNLLGDGYFEAYVDWSRLQVGDYFIGGSQIEANKNRIFVGCYEPYSQLPSFDMIMDSYYQKITAQQFNAYKNMLSATAKGVLKSTDDVHVAILGDSIWAGVGPDEFPDSEAKFLPPIMSNPTPSYWAYKFGVKNKAFWFRYDSGVISETGTWETEKDKFNTASGVHSGDGKRYGRTRQSSSINAAISFVWNLDEYKKMAFVHRLRYDGVSKVIVSISGGDGKVVVKHNQLANPVSGLNDGDWVEANGYEFTQLVPSATARHNGTDSFANFMTYFKAVDNVTDNITITFTRDDSDVSHYMYYWGFAIWNGRTILFDNCARGGASLAGVIGHCSDDVAWRHPDLIMLEIPLANSVHGLGGRTYQEIQDYLLGWLFQEGPSANANTYYGASIADNNIKNYVDAGKVIFFIANYFSKWVEENINAFVPLAPTENGGHQDRNCEMMYDSARLIFAQKDKQYIDYATIALSIADERNMLWYDIMRAATGDEPTLCIDGIHPSTLGAFIQGYLVANVLLNP